MLDIVRMATRVKLVCIWEDASGLALPNGSAQGPFLGDTETQRQPPLHRSRVNISNTFASGLLLYRPQRIVNSHILESLVDAVNVVTINPYDYSPPGPRGSTFVHMCNSRLCQLT